MPRIFLTLVCLSFLISPFAANAQLPETKDALKSRIFALAEKFKGKGDPDFTRQKQLEPLVQKLLDIAPQKPAIERIDSISGAWKQVWGPYDYRGDDRGVDPKLDPDNIYQVVFKDGYYYNVNPIQEGKPNNKTRISLLRGEYQINPETPNRLPIEFTRFSGNLGWPDNKKIWELAALAEQDRLPHKITIVPSLIVKLFFSEGTLREVYTDEDMRITYGLGDSSLESGYIYIMRRVGDAAPIPAEMD